MDVYVAVNGQSTGPVDVIQFLQRVGRGEYSSTDLAWAEGDEDWRGIADFLARHGLAADKSMPPPLPGMAPVAVQTPSTLLSFFVPAIGADILAYVRKCRVLAREDWVRWDDGRDELFELPVEVHEGQEIVVVGLQCRPRAGQAGAQSRLEKPLFNRGSEEVSWSLVINRDSGEEWSKLSEWIDALKTPDGAQALVDGKAYGFDLDRAMADESRKKAYYSLAFLLPLLADGAVGALCWGGGSQFLPNGVAVAIGVLVFVVLLARDVIANRRKGVYDYETVKARRVEEVKDGIVVRAALEDVESWLNGALSRYRGRQL